MESKSVLANITNRLVEKDDFYFLLFSMFFLAAASISLIRLI